MVLFMKGFLKMDWTLCKGCMAAEFNLSECCCNFKGITPVSITGRHCPCIKCLVKCVCDVACSDFVNYREAE